MRLRALIIFLVLDLGILFTQQNAYAASDALRVTEYYISGTSFSGSTYELTLDQNLVSNHFILVRGAASGNQTRGLDDNYARVDQLPSGMNGDLDESSGADTIRLSRFRQNGNWVGVVTVVECLFQCDSEGFQRLDVTEFTTGTTETSNTLTSANNWSDVNQVVPFGGSQGAGVTGDGASNTMHSGWMRLYPSGTNTINWERFDISGLSLISVTATLYVIEWGSSWTVQRVNVSGNNGGNGANATGEYDTGTITSVVRDNTWVWATGHSTDDGIGDGAEAAIYTLGDGVNQNTNETSVAVGSEYTDTRDFDVYTMTHADLDTDYRFKADGDAGNLITTVNVDNANTSNRMSWVANTCNGTGNAYPRPIFSSRYSANNRVELERNFSGQAFAAWVQALNFSTMEAEGSHAVQMHYRFRDDTTDLNTSGGFLAAEDTPYTSATRTTTYRLRMSVANVGDLDEGSARTYELQFGEKVTTCDAISTWTGVADASDAFSMVTTTHITPDGESTTSSLLANDEGFTRIDGEGRESADTTGSLGALQEDEYLELEYSFRPEATAKQGVNYCFRLYDTTAAAELDQYFTYPEISVLAPDRDQLHFQWRDDTTALNTAGGFLGSEDSNEIDRISKNETIRLRVEVANKGTNDELDATAYELQFAEKTSSCSSITTWTGVEDSSTDEFEMSDTTHISPDGQSLTPARLANTESYTFLGGEGRDIADTTGTLGPLTASDYIEIEYSINATVQAVTGANYCFRVFDSTSSIELESYSTYPVLMIEVADTAVPAMEWGTTSGISDDAWTTINFNNTFVNPVFVASLQYNNMIGNEADGTADSIVVRTRNLGTTSVEARIQETGSVSGTLSENEKIHWLVAEDGTYDNGDIKFEAFQYNSIVTDASTIFTGQTQTYTQTYTNPVVLGQVMTYNDSDWSVFYARGATQNSIPSALVLNTGKHVGQDTNTTRANETIGVLILESANDVAGGTAYEADVQGATIDRIDDSPPQTYGFASAFDSTPTVGVVSQAGIAGADGPFPVLYGSSPLSTSSISLSIMEDEIADTEQSGALEAVAYIVFEEEAELFSGVSYDQIAYRFYENIDNVQPTTALTSENAQVENVNTGDVVRLRLALQVGVNDLDVGDETFKLQYSKSDDCTTAASWTDVDVAGGTGIWRGFNNATPADNAAITSSLINGGTNTLESYQESNNTGTNLVQTEVGAVAEWDWVIENNGADKSSRYCFRMVLDAGDSFLYSRYPVIETIKRRIIITN